MTLIDTHAHLTDDIYEGQIDALLFEAKENNVNYIISSGYDIKSSTDAIELSHKYNNIFVTIGIHPENICDWNEEAKAKLIEMSQDKNVIGFGEIGLDYHYTKENIDEQKRVFIEQLELAHSLNLPVVIHNRDSVQDMVEILESHKELLTNGGVFHCFCESIEIFKRIKKLGLKIGVGGVITFKNAVNQPIVLTNCEDSDFILETDSPYLSPVPFRGTTNSPKNIKLIAEKIAELRNTTLDNIAKISTENVLSLYKKIKIKE